MLAFLHRPRVLVAACLAVAVVVAAVVVVLVAAVRSGSSGCSVGAPEVTLPQQLRALGEFDQPFDTADPRAITDAAVRAATALHSDLAGATAGNPVAETAGGSDRHDALVVPLSESGVDPSAPQRIVALVAFLRDCSGRAWYDDVDDLLHTDPSLLPQRFPVVTAGQAAATLGAAQPPQLVWRTSPFQPIWLDRSSGRSVAAGPPNQP